MDKITYVRLVDLFKDLDIDHWAFPYLTAGTYHITDFKLIMLPTKRIGLFLYTLQGNYKTSSRTMIELFSSTIGEAIRDVLKSGRAHAVEVEIIRITSEDNKANYGVVWRTNTEKVQVKENFDKINTDMLKSIDIKEIPKPSIHELEMFKPKSESTPVEVTLEDSIDEPEVTPEPIIKNDELELRKTYSELLIQYSKATTQEEKARIAIEMEETVKKINAVTAA